MTPTEADVKKAHALCGDMNCNGGDPNWKPGHSFRCRDIAAALAEAREEAEIKMRLAEAERDLNPIFGKSAEEQRLRAETAERERDELAVQFTQGHAADCGGMDTERGECACGWLQREGAHAALLAAWSRAETAEAEVARLRTTCDAHIAVIEEANADLSRLRKVVAAAREFSVAIRSLYFTTPEHHLRVALDAALAEVPRD